jgi:AraC-like DNA-binding protein
MLNNDISIAELGYRLGFKTNAHFSRVFKEYFNKTPRAFLSGNDFVNIF